MLTGLFHNVSIKQLRQMPTGVIFITWIHDEAAVVNSVQKDLRVSCICFMLLCTSSKITFQVIRYQMMPIRVILMSHLRPSRGSLEEKKCMHY